METNKAYVLLKHFNDTIDTWIMALDDYTLDMLCREPKPGSWSLGQMYTHIIDDTNWFVEQMKAALSTDADSDKEMHDNAKYMFKTNGFPDIMIEGPATNTFIPQPTNKDALRQSLQTIKDQVNRLDFSLTKTKGKTRHPGLLYFNALEWLQFAEMHMRHHFRQKKRIDLALGK
jgi:hypothetical protein